MLTMGFTNVYYTLWEVDEPTERYNVYISSKEIVQHCCYIQNLSKDYAKALKKIEEKANGQKFKIDLELKGHYSFDRILYTELVELYEIWQFSFGRLAGLDIRTCEDVWQLNRAMREEKNIRRRLYARKRLIELGELIKNVYGPDFGSDKYIPTDQYRRIKEKLQESNMSGHFFTNGERICVTVKKLRSTCFDTQWGTTFIQILQLQDGRIVKYKGSSPIDFNESDQYLTIKATVEHGEYNGQIETRLKRPKII